MVMLIALLILYLRNQLASGTIVFSVVIALITALITVGILRNQLKTAYKQSSATNYIREDSFDLQIKQDRFLYHNTDKRKVRHKE